MRSQSKHSAMQGKNVGDHFEGADNYYQNENTNALGRGKLRSIKKMQKKAPTLGMTTIRDDGNRSEIYEDQPSASWAHDSNHPSHKNNLNSGVKDDEEDNDNYYDEDNSRDSLDSGKNPFWKEIFASLSSMVLLFMSLGVLLYLLSYSKDECPV